MLTMPLAAYGEGLGTESTLFPVFTPAWLDQACELQRSQTELQQQQWHAKS